VALLFFGCQTPGATSQSPGNEGGDATAVGAFGAQTVGGDQGSGQTPQTATTGQATFNWFFASQGDSQVQMELLKALLALDAKPAEIIAAMQALNGAPENVTITTGDVSTQTGSSEQTGSTAGTGSLSGTGRTVAVPDNR
jgi:hypothetical protein